MNKLIIIVLLTSAICSCVAKKEVSRSEIKKDSITIEKNLKIIDSIQEKKTTKTTEPTSNKISIPCKDGDFNQALKVGGVEYTISVKDGKVELIVNTKEKKEETVEVNQVKSSDKELSKIEIKEHEKIEKKEVVKKPFFANLWQILFFIILILWAFGITPRFVFKLITKI